MTESDPLLDLLVKWEEQRQQGRPVLPEELCPDNPELQEALRQRISKRERFRTLWSLPEPTTSETEAPTLAPPRVEGLEILGTLGHGGVGVVYKARQAKLDRLVAVKVILTGANASPEERSRFRREAEAIARLQHPNIVQVYQVGEYQGCPYAVLEYVGGGTLAGQLCGTPLRAQRAAELVLTLARAVQHAHERGVLHRDLKPANVLLTEDGTPKIADFGLARRLDSDVRETATGAILGTPSYMAPEQAEGRVGDLGPWTDVYALGAILYEVLTGRPPFKGASVLETLEQVRTLDPVAPTALQPGVPHDLEVICLKCLEKEPRHRYPSAEAVARDLQCFLDGEPISARSLTILDRLARAINYNTPAAAGKMRSYGAVLLWTAPFPVLSQLVLFLLVGGWPSYPVICTGIAVLATAVVYPLVLWPMREPLRQMPRGYRRLIWSIMATRGVGYLLIPAIVALMRPGHDPAEFFLVFPLWIFLDGNYYLLLGSEGGLSYPVAVLFYAAALLATLAPLFSPLVAAGMISVSLLIDGLYLRLWRE